MMEFDNVGENNADGRRGVGDDSGGGAHGGDGQQAVYVTASSTRMDTVRFLHRWTIDQFSVQQELSQTGEFLESRAASSSPFGSSNGQYKFRLKLFPSGKDEDCRGYLSLFLQIQKCPTAKLRFRVNFYIETTEGPRGCALNKNVVTINKGGIVTASKFFSMETLKGRPSRFLPDDTLTVGVELTVFGEQSSREIQPDEFADNPQPSSHTALAAGAGAVGVDSPNVNIGEAASTPRGGDCMVNGSLGRDLAQLLDSTDHADVTVNAGRRTFRCHKALLAARSPVLRAMFAHAETREAQSGEATLEDVTGDAVASMLEFMYTDRCADLKTRAAEILPAAEKYQVELLKMKCEDSLTHDVSVDNLCNRLRLADQYRANKLRRRCLIVFQRHKMQVLDSRDWMDLEQEMPQLAAVVLKELMTMPDATGGRFTGFPSSNSDSSPAKRPRMA